MSERVRVHVTRLLVHGPEAAVDARRLAARVRDEMTKNIDSSTARDAHLLAARVTSAVASAARGGGR